MQVTDEQRDRIAEWLTSKNIKTCPICQTGDLEVYDHLYSVTPVEGGDTVLVVIVQCHNCVYMMHFSVDRMRLPTKEAPKPASQAPVLTEPIAVASPPPPTTPAPAPVVSPPAPAPVAPSPPLTPPPLGAPLTPPPTTTPTAATAALAPPPVWYYLKDGKTFGPVTEEQLKQLALAGDLKPKDLIWKAGLADWIEASNVLVLLGGT